MTNPQKGPGGSARARASHAADRLVRLLAGFALAFPVLAAVPSEARAEFRVCNESDETVGVALGYRAAEGWVSEGWWHVDGGVCEVLLPGALSSRFYYLYAENAERSQRWGGEVRMCTADREFKIVGVEDCVARGHTPVGFGEYDTQTQAAWTVRLTGSDDAAPASGSESRSAPLASAN